jgi:hypothetical protein
VTLLELNFQRRKAKKEAAEMLDKAVIEARSLTIAEQVRFDSLTARIHELDAAIAQRESLRKVVTT